jgi:TusA-related sulfurtransferase
MVFARNINDPLTSLVKEINKQKVNSFVVFLSDDEGMADKVKEFAEKNNIKKTILTVDNVAGPKGYNVAKDAEVTVVLYNKRKVEANHAFKQGELNAKGVERVISDIPKIANGS